MRLIVIKNCEFHTNKPDDSNLYIDFRYKIFYTPYFKIYYKSITFYWP